MTVFSSVHIFHRRHRRFISFVSKTLFVSYIDYYCSRSNQLIWQQNVLCMVKAGRERGRGGDDVLCVENAW